MILCLGGCGPIVRTAPYTERPDSVKSGSLLGPFTGQVVDAGTQQPLADAVVWCSWAFDYGLGHSAPRGVRTHLTRTDVDGRYVVPALRNFPQGLTTRLARFSLVVYRRGYVAYRNDRVFGQSASRLPFAQLDNVVRLVRWSPELSHARHLLFLGNAASVEEVSEWEVLGAAAELEGSAVPPGPASLPSAASRPADAPSLDASVLLSSEDVRAVTGYSGLFTGGRLPEKSTDQFDTYHLRAVDQPERYDIALRLWRPPSDKLDEKYDEILKALPEAKQAREVGDRSFTVAQGEILGLGFLDREAGAVVLLSCGRAQCTSHGKLLELARRTAKNLSKLPAPPSSIPAEEP